MNIKSLQKISYIAVPYIVVELLQYFLMTIIALIRGFIVISADALYILSASITAVCGIVFFFWYKHEHPRKSMKKTKKLFTAKNISLFILLGIGCQFFFSGMIAIIRPYFTKVFEQYAFVLENITAGKELVVLIFMLIVAPVSEELIFRGVIFNRANRLYSFIYANILQALLFGLYHGNLVQGIYAALIGFLLGAVCIKFESILASILLHMIINASSLLMVFVEEQLISYVIIMLLGGTLMVITILGLNITKSGKRQ